MERERDTSGPLGSWYGPPIRGGGVRGRRWAASQHSLRLSVSLSYGSVFGNTVPIYVGKAVGPLLWMMMMLAVRFLAMEKAYVI